MTKEKWSKMVIQAETNKNRISRSVPRAPENWFLVRAAIIEMVADIDEATEVYNMENSIK